MGSQKKGKRVAIVFDGLDDKGVCMSREYEAGESIIIDVRRVRGALIGRGDEVLYVRVLKSATCFLRRLHAARADLIFNLCEGAFNDSRKEMNICAMLELSGIPYTGCGPLALGVALNKGLAKKLLMGSGIPTPDFFVFDGNGNCAKPERMQYPLIVKPLREDASIGIDIGAYVTNDRELKRQSLFVIGQYRQPALVEQYIEGRELNVSVIGNEDPVTLPVSEIDMSHVPEGKPRICDYRAKWVNRSEEYVTTVPVCPAPLVKKVEREVKKTALAAYRLMGCRGYARVDIRLSSGNIPYVLEVNPNPCIGRDSGIVRSAAAAGLSYGDLVCKIADLALQSDS
jgi:D-alanine-D-alanine ligase